MIVTIDGPAGAGKSSAAKLLAQCLGFEFLDTGAMYRAVTFAGMRVGLDLGDQAALARLVAGLTIDMPPGQVLLNGENVTGLIRTPEITANSTPIAESRVVRQFLVERQRALAQGRNMVCEGRDQGTVVFPDALCKFFLFADPVERARRRQRDLEARGHHVPWKEVLRAQETRDFRDAARDVAPMVPAKDAILLDSTHLSLDEVVQRMVKEVRTRSDRSAG
jgi:cytidylate kinase